MPYQKHKLFLAIFKSIEKYTCPGSKSVLILIINGCLSERSADNFILVFHPPSIMHYQMTQL